MEAQKRKTFMRRLTGSFCELAAINGQLFYFVWDQATGVYESAREPCPAESKSLDDRQYRWLMQYAGKMMRLQRAVETLPAEVSLERLLGELKRLRVIREKERGVRLDFTDFIYDELKIRFPADHGDLFEATMLLQGKLSRESAEKRKARETEAARQGKFAF